MARLIQGWRTILNRQARDTACEVLRAQLKARGHVVRPGDCCRCGKAVPTRFDQGAARWIEDEPLFMEMARFLTSHDRCLIYQLGVEILGLGNQFVAFGMHPEANMPFEWYDDSPADIRLSELPEVTPEQLYRLKKILHAEFVRLGYDMPELTDETKVQTTTAIHANDDDEITEAKISEALAAITNNLDRDDWVRLGEALVAATNKSGFGFDLWNEFCRRWSGGTNTDREIRKAWNSFRPHSVSPATLFWFADQHDPSWRSRLPETLSPEQQADLQRINQHAGHPGGTIRVTDDFWTEMGFSEEELKEIRKGGARAAGEHSLEDSKSASAPRLEGPQATPEGLPPRWSEPVDVFGDMMPEPVLERDMLPRVIVDFAFDTAERIGADPALPAMAALVACASVLHDDIKIQPKHNDTRWKESARLWIAADGPSGTAKSPATDPALAPVYQIQRHWQKEDAERLRMYDREKIIFDAAFKQREKSLRAGDDPGRMPEEPVRPPIRQIIVDEMTMEALGADVLADNPRGVLLWYDELMGLIGSLDAYHNGHKDRPLLLKGWNGVPVTINRRGTRIDVPNFGFSILGGIQTEKLREIADKLDDDGCLQRFSLFRVRNHDGGDRAPDEIAIARYESTVLSISGLRPDGNVVVLSPEAQRLRREIEEITRAIRDMEIFPAALRSHANKWFGTFARLLLVMHVIDCAPDNFGGTDFLVVSEATAQRAYGLFKDFLIPNAIAVYTDYFGGFDQHNGDCRFVAGHILAHKATKLDERDLYRAKRDFESDRKRMVRAIVPLVHANWLQPLPSSKRADAIERWLVNPVVHTKFAKRREQEIREREAIQQRFNQHAKTISKVGHGSCQLSAMSTGEKTKNGT